MALTCKLSEFVERIEESAQFFAALTQLRATRRKDESFTGCTFCFDTCYGELNDGYIVPCADCNGLCL